MTCGVLANSLARSGILTVCCLAVARLLPTQPPQIQPGGVVNAASYAQPIAPGSIAAIFGDNLAGGTASASGEPLPYELAGTSVTVDGVSAPIFFVSPGQINIQVPRALNLTFFAFTPFLFVNVVVTNSSGSSAPASTPVYPFSPALFTVDSSGCGQAAALNVNADGSVSVNSPSNSASVGDAISLYGTGFGPVSPPDGTPATGVSYLENSPLIFIGGIEAAPSFWGNAPGLVGVDQINFTIPPGTPEGCAVPLEVDSLPMGGPVVALSVHSGGGQCVDQGEQLSGQISLTKTVANGTGADGTLEQLSAVFPSSPTVASPAASMLTEVSRSCVGGFSAGSIVIDNLTSGVTTTSMPIPAPTGVLYQQNLPAGFIGPGQYGISSAAGVVSLAGNLTVGSPVQITTSLAAGITITAPGPFTVSWTGGQPGTLVRLTLNSQIGVMNYPTQVEVDASAGSAAIQGTCVGQGPPGSGEEGLCSFGIPTSNTAEVIVEVLPPSDNVTTIAAQGFPGTVQALWSYRFVFGGLVIQNATSQ